MNDKDNLAEFPAGYVGLSTLVLMVDLKLTPIKHVQVGDDLIGASGVINKVLDVSKLPYDGPMLSIKVGGHELLIPESTVVLSPVNTLEAVYVKAGDLKPGSYLLAPNIGKLNKIDYLSRKIRQVQRVAKGSYKGQIISLALDNDQTFYGECVAIADRCVGFFDNSIS